MNTGIIVLFSRMLKKININILILLTLFVLGWVAYVKFMQTSHTQEVIRLTKCGPVEYYCDSIKVNLVAPLARFNVDSTLVTNFICFNKKPDIYYYYKGPSADSLSFYYSSCGVSAPIVPAPVVDSLRFLYSYYGRQKWSDSFSLTTLGDDFIKRRYFNCFSDSIFENIKGALFLHIAFNDNPKEATPLDRKKIKKMDCRPPETHFYQTTWDSNWRFKLHFINLDQAQSGQSTDCTAAHFFWNFTNISNGRYCYNGHYPAYPLVDSTMFLFSSFDYKNEWHEDNTLSEIPQWPGESDKIEIRHIRKKLNAFKKIYRFDLSQEAIDISFYISGRPLIKINSIAIPFENFPDFTFLVPEPDSIGKKVIFYTSPTKIEKLLTNGFHAFVKYPDQQNMQTARIFIMTMIMSLLLTGIINQTIRIIRNYKVKRKFRDKTKSCVISVLDCVECPLKLKCEQFKENQHHD